MSDDRIPQAQSDVLEPSGKRFTVPWFRFFTSLDGILSTISDNLGLGLLKANNLSDVASASTAFTNIKQSASGTTTGVVQQTQPEPWAHTISKVTNVTGRFLCVARTSGTIVSTYTDCASGTCTVRWSINGVAVGSTANSVSSTATTQSHSSANTFVAGDVITYTISANATCLEALLQANVTLSLAV